VSKKKSMVRKQLYIESDQNVVLREQAAKYGVSEGQIVREAITSYLKVGSWSQESDLHAWDEETEFIRSRLGNPKSTAKRTWTRSELYDL